MGYQEEKKLVRNYYDAMEKASPDEAERVLARFTSEDYNWKGVYPFREWGRGSSRSFLDTIEKIFEAYAEKNGYFPGR